MEISQILAIAAGTAHIVAYCDYNIKVFKGQVKPNGSTWLIWSAVAVLSITSYLAVTGDIWKCIIPLCNIFLCIITLIVAICLKHFKMPDKLDFLSIMFGFVAIAVWKHFGSAKYANLIVQFSILVGFYPTWRSVIKDPLTEKALPWWFWSLGYVFAITVVVLRWNGLWYDLVYPVNCLLLHSSVPILSAVRKKQINRLEPIPAMV